MFSNRPEVTQPSSSVAEDSGWRPKAEGPTLVVLICYVLLRRTSINTGKYCGSRQAVSEGPVFGKVRVCIQKNLLRTVLMISSVTQPSSSAAEDFHDKIQAQHPIWSSQVIIYLFGSVSEVSLYTCCSFHLMASSHRPKVQLTSSRRFRLDQGPMLVGLLHVSEFRKRKVY